MGTAARPRLRPGPRPESRPRRSTVAVAVALAAALASGCGGDDDCEVVCERNVECQADAPDQQTCVDLCDELSEDEDYADALSAQADCYEDETCAAIAAGACIPDDP